MFDMSKLVELKSQFLAMRYNSFMNETPFAFTEEDTLLEQYLTTTLSWILRAMSKNSENSYYEHFGKPEDDESDKNERRPED